MEYLGFWWCMNTLVHIKFVPSIRRTISYTRTIYLYNLCISFSFFYKTRIHFTLSPLYPHCILSCLLLPPLWIRFFILLSPCCTIFILGLNLFLVWPNLKNICNTVCFIWIVLPRCFPEPFAEVIRLHTQNAYIAVHAGMSHCQCNLICKCYLETNF